MSTMDDLFSPGKAIDRHVDQSITNAGASQYIVVGNVCTSYIGIFLSSKCCWRSSLRQSLG